MTAPDREAEALIDYLCEEAEHEVECAGEFTELAKQLRALEVTARRLARESITNKSPTDAEVMAHPTVKALVEASGKLLHSVCGDTGFAACVRQDSGLAYPWEPMDEAEAELRAALAAIQEAKP